MSKSIYRCVVRFTNEQYKLQVRDCTPKQMKSSTHPLI
jgi:hypothetical protein